MRAQGVAVLDEWRDHVRLERNPGCMSATAARRTCVHRLCTMQQVLCVRARRGWNVGTLFYCRGTVQAASFSPSTGGVRENPRCKVLWRCGLIVQLRHIITYHIPDNRLPW